MIYVLADRQLTFSQKRQKVGVRNVGIANILCFFGLFSACFRFTLKLQNSL